MIDSETQLSIIQMELERQSKELKRAIEHPGIKKEKDLLEKAQEWHGEISELNALLSDWNDAGKRRWKKLRRAKIVAKIANRLRVLKKKRDKSIEERINEIIGDGD